jgi:hypothetical protein
VDHVFPFNHEYWIRFTADDSPHYSGALLPWTGDQPVAGAPGSTG